MIYNVDYFIKKFEAIPEDRWTTGMYEDEGGAKCALGHCNFHITGQGQEGNDLYTMVTVHGNLNEFSVLCVNDGLCEKYQQPTPKQRVLALLHDIKKEINPETTRVDITSDLAVLPPDEKPDTINQLQFTKIN